MAEEAEKEKIAENQKQVFSRYLQRTGISSEDERAQRIIAKIKAFQISTFREEKIRKVDGSLETVTLADVHGGNMDTGTWRALFSRPLDKTLFNDMVALGFTLAIFDREPSTTGSFNGTWRGDGLPRT